MHVKGYLTINQAAEKLGLKADTLRRYCNKKKIDSSRIGWTILIRTSEVSRFKANRRKPGRPRKDVEK